MIRQSRDADEQTQAIERADRAFPEPDQVPNCLLQLNEQVTPRLDGVPPCYVLCLQNKLTKAR